MNQGGERPIQARNLEDEVNSLQAVQDLELEACPKCQRNFAPTRIAKHLAVCSGPRRPLARATAVVTSPRKEDSKEQTKEEKVDKATTPEGKPRQRKPKALKGKAAFQAKFVAKLLPCEKCNRNFAPDRITKHHEVCKGPRQAMGRGRVASPDKHRSPSKGKSRQHDTEVAGKADAAKGKTEAEAGLTAVDEGPPQDRLMSSVRARGRSKKKRGVSTGRAKSAGPRASSMEVTDVNAEIEKHHAANRQLRATKLQDRFKVNTVACSKCGRTFDPKLVELDKHMVHCKGPAKKKPSKKTRRMSAGIMDVSASITSPVTRRKPRDSSTSPSPRPPPPATKPIRRRRSSGNSTADSPPPSPPEDTPPPLRKSFSECTLGRRRSSRRNSVGSQGKERENSQTRIPSMRSSSRTRKASTSRTRGTSHVRGASTEPRRRGTSTEPREDSRRKHFEQRLDGQGRVLDSLSSRQVSLEQLVASQQQQLHELRAMVASLSHQLMATQQQQQGFYQPSSPQARPLGMYGQPPGGPRHMGNFLPQTHMGNFDPGPSPALVGRPPVPQPAPLPASNNDTTSGASSQDAEQDNKNQQLHQLAQAHAQAAMNKRQSDSQARSVTHATNTSANQTDAERRQREHPARQREECGRPGCSASAVSLCGRCRVVRYCSRQCQEGDWTQHSASCVQFQR